MQIKARRSGDLSKIIHQLRRLLMFQLQRSNSIVNASEGTSKNGEPLVSSILSTDISSQGSKHFSLLDFCKRPSNVSCAQSNQPQVLVLVNVFSNWIHLGPTSTLAIFWRVFSSGFVQNLPQKSPKAVAYFHLLDSSFSSSFSSSLSFFSASCCTTCFTAAPVLPKRFACPLPCSANLAWWASQRQGVPLEFGA